VRFSALVLTYNEELQIESCLRSLASADRVVLIDSGSTDRTLEIVSSIARVEIQRRPFVSFADQRNHGIENAFERGTWVLHLDADERLTPELAGELNRLEPPERAVAYNIAPRTYLRGRPVLRASGFPVYQTRLTRAGFFRFEQVGHGQKAPDTFGILPRLRQPYDHHPFEKGYEAWRERHERYAEAEARLLSDSADVSFTRALRDPILWRRWLNRVSARVPFRPGLVWFYLMFVRGGAWDGAAGWEYCRLRRTYERMVVGRLRSGTPGARFPE